MKKFLAVIVFALLGAAAHAQTLTLNDITNLASLNSSQAHSSLTLQRPFQETYTELVNGRQVDHYHGNTPQSKCETVTIGFGDKGQSGAFLHTVTYESTNIKYVLNLIVQAKGLGLKKEFQGADATSNIFLYDSFLYTVNIYLNNDRSKGSVVVKQNVLQ